MVPADILQTETPTIDPVSAGDTTVSGTAETGATVTITLPEGDPITAEADDEGNWEATVPELSEGDSVTVAAESEQRSECPNHRECKWFDCGGANSYDHWK